MWVCVCLQLPRAVNTQALSGAGLMKMFSKATDAVSKMTIKMNESDVVSSAVNTHCCCSQRFSLPRSSDVELFFYFK